MSYRGSAALDAQFAERGEERRQQATRPSFTLVEGEGLDKKARSGVSLDFLVAMRALVMAAVIVATLGMVRVSLTTATVSMLQGNAALESSIEDVQTQNQNLKVERSVLSAGSRIGRIASQNYGMVLTSSKEVVDVSAQGATDPTDVDSSDAGATDGDAAQTAQDGSVSADEA